MSGKFPSTVQSQNLSANFLKQASCNSPYSSLPVSAVTSTISSAFSTTWPNLSLSGEVNSNSNCESDSNGLEPDALIKLLSDVDEPTSQLLNHKMATSTTHTFSNQVTSTFKADTNNVRTPGNSKNCFDFKNTSSSVSSYSDSLSSLTSNLITNSKASSQSNSTPGSNSTCSTNSSNSFNFDKEIMNMISAKSLKDGMISTVSTSTISSPRVKVHSRSEGQPSHSSSNDGEIKLAGSDSEVVSSDEKAKLNDNSSSGDKILEPKVSSTKVNASEKSNEITEKNEKSENLNLNNISTIPSPSPENAIVSNEKDSSNSCKDSALLINDEKSQIIQSDSKDSSEEQKPDDVKGTDWEVTPNPDNVESLLESMFQMNDESKNSQPSLTTTNDPTKNRALRAESIEKILKSPSPPPFNGESNTDLPAKSPAKELVDIKEERDSDIFVNRITDPVSSDDKENDSSSLMCGITGSSDKPIKIFNEIESELEKMFAGIVEPEVSKVKTEPLALSSPLKIEENFKNLNVTKIKNSRRSSDNSILSSCSSNDNKKPKKESLKRISEKKGKRHLSKKFKIDKDTSNDSFYSKLKGPVIRVEGPRDNPTRYTIINCRSKPDDEDALDSKSASSKKKISCQRTSNTKVTKPPCSNSFGSDGPISIDSSKLADSTWICVFCKKGPHVPGVGGDSSGDLFGPYYIKEVKDPQPVPSCSSIDQKIKKKKKSLDSKNPPVQIDGVLPIPNSSDYEVWVHESCCIWASGVHLVGTKLQGLDEAVWEACKTKCGHCGISGASLGCAARLCPSRFHYSCALHTGWCLDQETFITKCSLHDSSFLFSPSLSSSSNS